MIVQQISMIFGDITDAVHHQLMRGKGKQYIKIIGITAGISVFLLCGFLCYRWYRVGVEQNAQKVLSENIAQYNAMLQAETKNWEYIVQLFQAGAESQSHSSLAPYFLAFQADALIQDGRFQQAFEVMTRMVQALPKSSPLYSLFKTKRAMMCLDMNDEAIQKEGVQELIALGRDKTNLQNDVALYQLGEYYLAKNDVTEAVNVWKELVGLYEFEVMHPSPWAQMAQRKLYMVAA
jgi:tetratricopeptide (TPR) repeat protein